jgi:hypothetical protein
MKKHSIRRTLLAISVTACLIPAYAQGQSTGSGAFPNPRGDNSTITPNQSGSAPTKDIRPPSDMPDLGSRTTPRSSADQTQSQSGVGDTNNSMTKDKALTETDVSLNNRIRTAFSADSSMRGSTQEVSLHSDNGVVTLTGTVATEKEKADLENRVQHMTGVKEVKNNLLIAPHASISSPHTPNTSRQ